MQPKMRAGILAIVATMAVSAAARADVVHDWNQVALTFSFTAGPPQARVLAMMHVAMHDAINAVTGEYETYLPAPPVLPGTSSTAAGAWAAYQVLANLIPGMEPTWKAARDASVAGIAEPAQTNGKNVGVAVGNAMVELRLHDGFSAPVSYTPGSGPGIWVPTEPAFRPALFPQFGLVMPFALNSGSQFRPDGPPGLTADRYTADFNEIKIVGSIDAEALGNRTPEQTATAQFWLGNSIPIFQGIARRVSTDLSESANARFFALMSIAGLDAYIAAWDAKYAYNFWRPVTAIRNADIDGNPDTTADGSWRPFADTELFPGTPPFNTPPFPDYVSGHTTYTGAFVHVLEHVFGRDAIAFKAISVNAAGTLEERCYASFRELSDEMIEARILAGIHFRTADVDGDRLGRQVAQFAIAHTLRPAHTSQHE